MKQVNIVTAVYDYNVVGFDEFETVEITRNNMVVKTITDLQADVFLGDISAILDRIDWEEDALEINELEPIQNYIRNYMEEK